MTMFTIRALVLGTDELAVRRRDGTAMFTRTPLDMMQVLELHEETIEAVVLSGEFSERDDIASFLRDSYPQIAIRSDGAVGCTPYQRAS